MAASIITAVDTSDIFISGNPFAKGETNGTLLKISARSTVMAQYTLLGKIAATGKWAPYLSTATDGSAVSMGIYMGSEIAAATIAAADVTGLEILYADAFLDEDKLVMETGTLDTVITGSALTFDAGTGDSTASLSTVNVMTVRDALVKQGIVFREVDSVSAAQR